MIDISQAALIKYYTSCDFLWNILSLFLYLDEVVANENIDVFSKRWAGSSEEAAKWTIEEKYYLLNNHKEIFKGTEKPYSQLIESLGDYMMVHLASLFNKFSNNIYSKYQDITKAQYLYISYCASLSQVLLEFDNLMRELGSEFEYYKRYQALFGLIQSLIVALNQELLFLDISRNLEEDNNQYVWKEIDEFSTKIRWLWRQAIDEVAENRRLPDFFSDDNS